MSFVRAIVRVGRWRWITPLLLILGAVAPALGAERFKIHVAEDGLYRVEFDDLRAAAPTAVGWPSAGLGLSWRGKPVPIRLDDGGDGRFGPGDAIEFFGRRLAGDNSWFHEFAAFNVYVLETDRTNPARPAEVTGACLNPARERYRREHLERDLLRVRFDRRAGAEQEVWFWAKLTQLDEAPFELPLRFPDLERGGNGRATLQLHLRGWSRLPARLTGQAADHRIELLLNAEPLGQYEWNNAPDGYRLSVPDLDPALWDDDRPRLEVRVVPRVLGGEDRASVDVILVNWVEFEYPLTDEMPVGQSTISRLEPADADCLSFSGAVDPAAALYAGAWRSRGRVEEAGSGEPRSVFSIGAVPEGELRIVADGQARPPLLVEFDRPSDLRGASHPADHIMIAHPRLIEATRPLAEFHRGRGLQVTLVDVVDVYDEFSGGIPDPAAIREYLEFAWRHQVDPAPRFVLLVGDASWDSRNTQARDENYADWTYREAHAGSFGKNTSTPYSQLPELNHRNLVPTWTYLTGEGQAASDTRFVDFDDDGRPELAIGRIPVTTPEEVAGVVAKTIRYASRTDRETWRRRILWITNEEQGSQRRSDQLAGSMEQRGFVSKRIYPAAAEASNEQNRLKIRQALDDGQLIVHFYGHGGRYIWRTGPPDLRKNHDLFTLEDLDELQAHDRLPVVLSMTCYSAPFDHPNADSIGEKLLRMPDRGAVAVLAASWRNSPTRRMSELLLEELVQAATVGEAIMLAKRRSKQRDFQYQYNLLGDPAIPLGLPQLEADDGG